MPDKLIAPPSPAVLADAQRIYKEFLAKEDYPEDLWVAIQTHHRAKDSDWDLNLYQSDYGEKLATLYFVIDDETQIEQGFPVELPKD